MRFYQLCYLVGIALLALPAAGAEFAPVVRAVFRAEFVRLESSEVLSPVEVSYETSGTLNAAKDNVLFVCPEFRSLGHAAGPEAGVVSEGQLESLVGPGLLFDTNKLFVVCSDGLGCPLINPKVVSTGPSSIHAKTGKPYGMDFPTYTFGDMALLHRMLLESLGIKKVKILIGQSMGAWQVMEWIVAAPETVENAILVAADGRIQPLTANAPFGLGIAQIMADPAWNRGQYYDNPAKPVAGVMRAQWSLISWTTSYGAMEQMYQAVRPNIVDRLEAGLDPLNYSAHAEAIVCAPDGRMILDPNAWIYRARAAILSDPGRTRGGYSAALDRVKCRVLIAMSESDILTPAKFGEETVAMLKEKGKDAVFCRINAPGGHVGLCKNAFDRRLLIPALEQFLAPK